MARRTVPEILRENLLDHPAVRAWGGLRPERVEPESVQVLRERKNSSIYRLAGVGAEGSAVIAKRSRSSRTAIERTVYEEALPLLPLTAPRYYGGEESGSSGWIFLEDVGAERYSILNDEHMALAGRWVGRMHTSVARAAGAARLGEHLPDGGPSRYLEHLRSARRNILANLSNPALSPDDVTVLEAIVSLHDRLEATWDRVEASCEGMQPTLVHGDFRPKNAYVRGDSTGLQLFPIDWETAGWGVPAADLTRVDLAAYHSVVREDWPSLDVQSLERVAAAGQIFRFLAAIGWESPSLAYPTRQLLIGPMVNMRVFRAKLSHAMRRLNEWTEITEARRPTDGLARMLEETGQPGGIQLEELLREILGDVFRTEFSGTAMVGHWGQSCPENRGSENVPHGRGRTGGAIGLHRLKSHVFRLQVETGHRVQSLVLKCMGPVTARRNELIAKRWLPALGLGDGCPSLLGVAADPRGRRVWHVYEDLGDGRLDEKNPDPARVVAAVDLIARLHTRSAGHPLLAEWRHQGGDLGIPYFASNVRDAVRGLEALAPPAVDLSPDHRDLRDRLLARLYPLLDELPQRARQMEELGGPELLLHGDLWTTNTFVFPAPEGVRARLIDWEHAAAGRFSYDLSTFLYRFPAGERPWILDAYRQAVVHAGWRLPVASDLNLLFDTAERARYANRVLWPAIALLRGEGVGWAFEELAEVDRWFEALEPVLAV